MGLHEDYLSDGYVIHPRPVIPEELVGRAMDGMDDVLAGRYETGIPPQPSYWNPGDDPDKLGKVEMPQLANHAIMELVGHPAIGRLAAKVTGARRVQVWWVQLLSKPPVRTESGSGVSVGWHQDRQYWKTWKEGSELFTAWVAVSNVSANTGPMAFVTGSHKWGLLNQGEFYFDDIEIQREQITLPHGETWREEEAILPPGGVSFHHCLTFHGSRPNRSGAPRRSFAIHMRTENSCPVAPSEGTLAQFIHNTDYCPVVYDADRPDLPPPG